MGSKQTGDGLLLTGAQCQFARNKLGLTQAKLARDVGVSRSQIANFETNGERFTPSLEVRKKLREYFEDQDSDIGEDLDAVAGGAAEESAPASAISSKAMAYVQRLTAAGCFRMSVDLPEVQRDRLLDEMERVRDRLEEIAETRAKPGVFDPFDAATDELITEADGLVKRFGFLCIVGFGYGFISLPTPALLERKQKPATIADVLMLKYSDEFKRLGIKKRDARPGQEPEEDEEGGETDETATPATPARSPMPWMRSE